MNFLNEKMKDILVGLIVAIILGFCGGIRYVLIKRPKEQKTLRLNKIKSPMNELLPLIQGAEVKLDCLENQLIFKNYDEFNQCIFEIEKVSGVLSKFLDKVEKPKKLRKRLEKRSCGKLNSLTFFEEVYEIYSMLDTIIFLGYDVLTLKEEGENLSAAEKNLEEELNKTYLLIKK